MLNFLASQAGLDLLKMKRIWRTLPAYVAQLRAMRRAFPGEIRIQPCLLESGLEGGNVRNEYFWQDLFVAQQVHQACPQRHLDVGSRLDGFVAHVASFRPVEVMDCRPLPVKMPNIRCHQGDLTRMESIPLPQHGKEYADSISCLHAMEHFGLGRYGDPLDPEGYKKGFIHMARMLCPGGRFYLSVPVGRERIEFNANWVFHPGTILDLASGLGLILKDCYRIDPQTGPQKQPIQRGDWLRWGKSDYALVLFIFQKKGPAKV